MFIFSLDCCLHTLLTGQGLCTLELRWSQTGDVFLPGHTLGSMGAGQTSRMLLWKSLTQPLPHPPSSWEDVLCAQEGMSCCGSPSCFQLSLFWRRTSSPSLPQKALPPAGPQSFFKVQNGPPEEGSWGHGEIQLVEQ